MILLKRLTVEDFKLLERVELTFPRQGSVLVEGLNESGKSTLFESVFFALYGLPLATEGRGKGNLENLIRYGEDSASVWLLLEVDDVELEVHRVVRRGKPNQADLSIRRPGAPEEKVAGVQAVNARIVDQLGGLDSEALLNSCFVEQKKLSKLEDLAPAQRKDSLRRVLNLDRLAGLADRFRVTTQDEQALAQARDRVELAEIARQLPGVVAERAKLEMWLGRVVLSGKEDASAFGQIGDGGRGRSADGRNEAYWSAQAVDLVSQRVAATAARRKAAGLSVAGLVGLAAIVALMVAGYAEAAWGWRRWRWWGCWP